MGKDEPTLKRQLLDETNHHVLAMLFSTCPLCSTFSLIEIPIRKNTNFAEVVTGFLLEYGEKKTLMSGSVDALFFSSALNGRPMVTGSWKNKFYIAFFAHIYIFLDFNLALSNTFLRDKDLRQKIAHCLGILDIFDQY